MTDVYVNPMQTDGLLFTGEMYKVKACIDDYWMVEGDDLAVTENRVCFGL